MPLTSVRVRFAPSPTGFLHIGGLRTALYNYLFARQHGGQFLLRIEDTDRKRFVPEAEPDILEALRWTGLAFDEGPGAEGGVGPYYQSQRGDLYRTHADQLVAAGQAYYAFDTEAEIEAMRARLSAAGNAAPRYDATTRMDMRNALTLPPEEVAELIRQGVPYVVRLKVPEDTSVTFDDLVRGTITFNTREIDDQVLMKSDGLPTYHLANVVDDHLMGITHVIRGEEWLPSTPKHVLMYQYFGWTPPAMAHLPLILSPQGGKLSKRFSEKSGVPVLVHQYREGYQPPSQPGQVAAFVPAFEPEALINYLALLGWNPGTEQELFSLETLADAFSLDRVGSAGVQYSMDKLRWFNEQYLRAMPPDELARRARPAVEAAGHLVDFKRLVRIAALMQERITFAADLATAARFFFLDPASYDEKAVKKRWKDDAAGLVRDFAGRLAQLPDFEAAPIEAALHASMEAHGIGMGRIMAPVRLAITGLSAGPGLYDTMTLLGRETCIRRLHKAADELG